jgi:hypothetical protein
VIQLLVGEIEAFDVDTVFVCKLDFMLNIRAVHAHGKQVNYTRKIVVYSENKLITPED